MTIILIYIYSTRTMYVCICQAITDRQVRKAVATGAHSVDALRDTLGVASCCGTCTEAAQAVIDETRPRPHAAPVRYLPDVQHI
ncbi:MAG: bacterioferritin-associated ferredoxin [Pseudomonadota bacterium]